MILPDKYRSADDSLLGLAALILENREPSQTISNLWIRFGELRETVSFDRFVEALTLLHILGAVDIDDSILDWETT